MESGRGKKIPEGGIDTQEWRKWPETEIGYTGWQEKVAKMKTHPRWGYDPEDLEEARILLLYQADTNGTIVDAAACAPSLSSGQRHFNE